MNHVRLLLLFGIISLNLSACSVEKADTAASSSTNVPATAADVGDTVFPTPDPHAEARECGWQADIYAWIDENRNGHVDPQERPLEGVKLTLFYSGERENTQPNYTDRTGHFDYDLFVGGCYPWTFEVEATAPSGYVATTPQRIRSAYPNASDEQPFLFGFALTQ